MDWKEYSYLADAFRTRFGNGPPTMLTPQGGIEYMRRALRGQSEWTADKDGPEPSGKSDKPKT